MFFCQTGIKIHVQQRRADGIVFKVESLNNNFLKNKNSRYVKLHQYCEKATTLKGKSKKLIVYWLTVHNVVKF